MLFVGRDEHLDRDGSFYVSQCDNCGLTFQNPGLTAERVATHYPDDYTPYQDAVLAPGRTALWHLRNRFGYTHLDAVANLGALRRWWGGWTAGLLLLPRFVPNGRVLELGCASGNHLSMLRDLGWAHLSGIELNPVAAERARARGFRAFAGRIEDHLDEAGPQDAVTMSFVLEHLEDPYEVTRRVAGVLPSGGQYLFSTVNAESLDRQLFGPSWLHWDLPRHYTFFRRRDLERMLAPHFEIERVTYKPSPNDFLGSVAYRKRRGPRWVDRMLERAGEQGVQRLAVVLALLGQTSRICVHARKR